MRIKSSFKDYYDCMQKFVYGNSPVYTRNWYECNHIKPVLKSTSLRYEQFVLGFCGTMYYGARTVREITINKKSALEVVYHFSAEQYIEWAKSNKLHYFVIQGKEERRHLDGVMRREVDDSYFIKENSPIIFSKENNYGPNTIICCPLQTSNRISHVFSYTRPVTLTLKDLGFDKVLSKEDAYTQLCGYIGGTLSSEYKSVPEMSNETKISIHGFDEKSFRKQ